MNSHNILIACDKFKGSLSADEVAQAIRKGLAPNYPKANFVLHPIADGGDGSLAILKNYLAAEEVTVETYDPILRKITANYLLADETAYIELAAASGIALLSEAEQNPLSTSTVGTGILMKDALAKQAKKIVLMLGGSATNDAGFGILKVLGFKFLNEQGKALLPIGGVLKNIQTIVPPTDLPKFELEIWCDVNNPMYGPTGATHVYSYQKGGDDITAEYLEVGVVHVSNLIKQQFQVDIQAKAGAGAAGGVAGGLYGLLNATLKPGFAQLYDLTGLYQKLLKADLIITGEGKLDTQSLQGKVIGKLAERCVSHQKRLIAVVGKNELSDEAMKTAGIETVYSIMSLGVGEEAAINDAESLLEQLSRQIKL